MLGGDACHTQYARLSQLVEPRVNFWDIEYYKSGRSMISNHFFSSHMPLKVFWPEIDLAQVARSIAVGLVLEVN